MIAGVGSGDALRHAFAEKAQSLSRLWSELSFYADLSVAGCIHLDELDAID